jgi:activator of HSP90 ATPase
MASTPLSRRAFAVRLAAVSSSLGFAGTAFGAAGQPAATAGLAGSDGLSHTSEAIHQEVVLNGNRRRVYEALTDAQQFDKVTRLGAAMKAAMAPGAAPTTISRDVGGAFSLFGGYVTGRHVELLADERIVQVWRAGSWKPGDYSIARFVLADEGTGTKLVFDHRGFPEGAGAHLAEGWHINYWQPLEKYLRSGAA